MTSRSRAASTTPAPSSSGHVYSTQIKTLAFSDLTGSTKIVSQVGDERAAAIFQRHDIEVRALLREHGGVELERTDGFLAMFDRPIDAVRYALGIHPLLEEISSDEGVVLAARVGIHMGEVVLVPVDDGSKPLEAEGITRVVCARLMALAQAGQTLISRGAFDLARRASVGTDIASSGVRWQSHGQYVLKGVEFDGASDPIEVCEVGFMGHAPFEQPPDTEKASRYFRPSQVGVVKIKVPELGILPRQRLVPVIKILIMVLVVLGVVSTTLLLLLPKLGDSSSAEQSPFATRASTPSLRDLLTNGDLAAARVAAEARGPEFVALLDGIQGAVGEALAGQLGPSATGRQRRDAVRQALRPAEQGTLAEPDAAWNRLLYLRITGDETAGERLERIRSHASDFARTPEHDRAWALAGSLWESRP